MKYKGFKTFKHCIVAGFLAALLCVFIPSASTQAQITQNVRIELSDPKDRIYLGEQAFVVLDENKNMDEDALWELYEAKSSGSRAHSNMLHSGLLSTPLWLLFSVRNESDTEDWVLNFGGIMDGRHSMAGSLRVSNITTGDVIVAASRDDNLATQKADKVFGNSVFMKIPQNELQFFAVYLETEGAFVNSVTPSLMSKSAYIDSLRFGYLPSNLMYLFFIIAVAFFIAIGFIQKSYQYGLYAAYFALCGALFFILNASFVIGGLSNILSFAALFVVSLLLALLMTRDFLSITKDEFLQYAALVGSGGFMIVGFVLYAVMYDSGKALDDIILFSTIFTAIIVMAGSGFLQETRGKYAGSIYGLGWVVYFLGLASCGLSAADILPSHFILVNAFWFALIGQFICIAYAVLSKNEQEYYRRKQIESREMRAEKSIERLQHSKESADQARLLRVIERERELMSELREREMQRTAEMREAKIMADEANAAKSAFLAVVSHEIRTPMTGIMGMVKLLLDTQMNKQQHDYVQAVQNSGDTMMALLNDILDFEKIESGNMDLEFIDCELDRLIQGILTLMSGHAVEKDITLECDISDSFPASLLADPTRLRQVLLNLVNNAIKFTERGSVRIIMSSLPVPKDELDEKTGHYHKVYFCVEDTGIGISEEAQANLFQAFSQAESSTSRKYGGTGLGLAICKRLVEAMGGEIHVESVEGQGSRFSFSLTMKEGENGQSKNSAGRSDSLATAEIPPMRLLIVEDNAMNRKVLAEFLKKDGHVITEAESGEAGLELLGDETAFDAIFCDVNMPGMGGIEMVKAMRAHSDPSVAATPVIALTGNVRDEDIQAYYAANMNGFMPKPIESKTLQETLLKIHTRQFDQPILVNADGAEEKKPETEQPEELYMDDPHVAPIQAFVAQESEENDVVDKTMIRNLRNNLGEEALQELLSGFWDTTDSLIDALQDLVAFEDTDAIYERAHELKGMAANFGFLELARISAVIEDAVKDNDKDAGIGAIKKLPDANQRAKDAL